MMNAPASTLARHRSRTQRGAAALVVVMLLLLIVALVAGYTARNLLFEQRTSVNQYRSTQAFEAAEAGIEWALAMLNAGRIDTACTPHDDPTTTDTSFRQRYLQVAVDTGLVTALKYDKDADGVAEEPLRPSCVFDGTDWQCSCPVDGAPVLADPVGPGPFPAFRVTFREPASTRPGLVQVVAVGCTRLDAADVCADAAGSGDSRAELTVLAALKSGLAVMPVAGVTARGRIDAAAGTLSVFSPDAAAGYTLHAGVAPSVAASALHPPAGTPVDQSIIVDATFADAQFGADRMFAAMFATGRYAGLGVDTYRDQPATIVVDCTDDCTAARVRDLVRLNPGRMVWIDGDFTLDVADPVGTAAAPALLVVAGSFTVADAAAQVHGLVYTIDPDNTSWTHAGNLTLRGAVVGESDLTFDGAGTTTVVHDRAVLARLHRTHGSFVRVPGSWKDF